MNKLEVIDFTIYHNNILYKIIATPYLFPAKDGMPLCFGILLNGKNMGDLQCLNEVWENDNIEDKDLLKKIVSFIYSKYNETKKVLEVPRVENEKALFREP